MILNGPMVESRRIDASPDDQGNDWAARGLWAPETSGKRSVGGHCQYDGIDYEQGEFDGIH